MHEDDAEKNAEVEVEQQQETDPLQRQNMINRMVDFANERTSLIERLRNV